MSTLLLHMNYEQAVFHENTKSGEHKEMLLGALKLDDDKCGSTLGNAITIVCCQKNFCAK